jgi:hypothetical protein
MANKKCSDGFSADGVSGSFNTLGQSQTTGETLIVYYCSGIDNFLAHQWIRYTPNKSGVTIGFSGG